MTKNNICFSIVYSTIANVMNKLLQEKLLERTTAMLLTFVLLKWPGLVEPYTMNTFAQPLKLFGLKKFNKIIFQYYPY